MFAANKELWRLRMRSEVVHESWTGFISSNSEIFGISIFLQRFFCYISLNHVLFWSKLTHFLVILFLLLIPPKGKEELSAISKAESQPYVFFRSALQGQSVLIQASYSSRISSIQVKLVYGQDWMLLSMWHFWTHLIKRLNQRPTGLYLELWRLDRARTTLEPADEETWNNAGNYCNQWNKITTIWAALWSSWQLVHLYSSQGHPP